MENQSKSVTKTGLKRFVGVSEVCEALGCSRSTLDRMRRDSLFPPAQQISPNRVGWPVDIVSAFMDQRRDGLVAKAKANPDDLAPEQLAETAVDLLTRAVEHEIGEPIDPRGLRVTYAPPSPEVSEAQLADAEAREAAFFQQRFAGFDATRSTIVAAWLFPELREAFAAGTANVGARAAFLDPQKLGELARQALSDEAWATANAELDGRRPGY